MRFQISYTNLTSLTKHKRCTHVCVFTLYLPNSNHQD
uniref:Uncharacterized protein n=1 Tax=Arundo donax TaxID=35708 RepID=A0A0A9H085_ARUDO